MDVVGTAVAVTFAQLLPYIVLPMAVVVMMIRKCPQWTILLARVLAVLVVMSWLGYWILWFVAFEYLDAYQPVPRWFGFPRTRGWSWDPAAASHCSGTP